MNGGAGTAPQTGDRDEGAGCQMPSKCVRCLRIHVAGGVSRASGAMGHLRPWRVRQGLPPDMSGSSKDSRSQGDAARSGCTRLLVEWAGEPVGKEDLIAAAWPGLAVEDSNLQRIFDLVAIVGSVHVTCCVEPRYLKANDSGAFHCRL